MNSNTQLREGLIWVSFSKYFSRILSIISTFVLAKLLTPEDFGIVAISMAIVQGLQIFRDVGVPASIITDKENSQELINTGATVFISLGLIVFIFTIIIAPVIAKFLNDIRLVNAIRVMSISILFTSFSMINSTKAQKELKFKKNAQPEIISQIAYVVLSVIFAYLGMSYWSIIYGFVISSIIKTIFFFILFPVKFKLSINRIILNRIFSFSIYSFVNSVLIFLFANLDRIFIGRVLNIEQVGYYFLAFKIANIPSEYIYSIIISLLLPYYSKLSIKKLKERYLDTIQYLAIIIIPVSFLILISMKPLFNWLYQDKWLPVISLLQILIFYGIIRSLFGPMGIYVYAKRKPRIQTNFLIIQSLISYSLILFLWNNLNAILVAFIFTGTLIVQFIFWIIYLKFKENISIVRFLKLIYTPFVVSIFSYYITKMLINHLHFEYFFEFVFSIAIFSMFISIFYYKIYRKRLYEIYLQILKS
ncbi:MAG: lipopolysaccharide biosynthesis protein [Candidatus Helarchaeota archaeon]